MAGILFLLGDIASARNDNHERLPAAFDRAGWQVTCADHNSVSLRASTLSAAGQDPGSFDLIWLLGFGQQVNFLDRMQLLRRVPQQRFVTGVDALTYLHGKHHFLEHMPETHTSNDIRQLARALSRGGEWILKPTAGSYGRDVVHIRSAAEGARALQQARSASPDAYLMLQRYVPAIVDGEKRTLVAAGEIIGSYLRKPAGTRSPAGPPLANLNAGASVAPTVLTDAERALVTTIARNLATAGAGFAAIDIVFPYLMEVNVANPGGLETLVRQGMRDATDKVVDALTGWR